MPDRRTRRGPHPRDAGAFEADALPSLAAATGDYCWLLGRGYSPDAALKLVGDRHQLRDRQRRALQRVAASETDVERRAASRVLLDSLAGEPLLVDGYNVLITIEAALSGGVLLLARDGTLRDLAAMSRHYKRVRQTRDALAAIGDTLAAHGCQQARWLFDRPVSNSGRLRSLVLELAGQRAWAWEVELTDRTDRTLIDSPWIVATADSAVLDRCRRWVNLARAVVAERVPGAWVVAP